MSQFGKRIVTAAAWAQRVRPRWYITWAVLFVLGGLLTHFELMSLPARIVILGVLAFFYLLPWTLAVVRNFQAGLRGDDSPA